MIKAILIAIGALALAWALWILFDEGTKYRIDCVPPAEPA